MTTEKVSVSLDAGLVAEARRRSQGRSTLSAYLNDALRRKLYTERQLEFLDQLDEQFGTVPSSEEESALDWWQRVREDL